MNLLSAENLSINFGDKLLFANISFGIDKGDRIALIASNGTGKTTLLNILAGIEKPDTGTVVVRDGIRIGYLQQEPQFEKHLTIKETIKKHNSFIAEIISEYQKAVAHHAVDFSEEARKQVDSCSKKMDFYGGWDYDRRMIEILSKLQIHDLQQTVGTLSGGQVKRLALASVLIDNPDILLLDEPTNHMDIGMIEWLEDELTKGNKTAFIVSHDRYFLDNVCTRIIEMEENSIFHHKGNYLYYLEKSLERKSAKESELAKAKQLYRKELEWMRTQPKARTHKAKSRIDAFYEIENKAKNEIIKKELKLDLKIQRLGNKILELHNVCKRFNDTVILDNFSYVFKKGDRIGIVGQNGTGKTTFLNILTGTVAPDAGKIHAGETIRLGYLKQDGLTFDENKKVIDIVKDIAEDIILSDGRRVSASQFLDFFLLPPKMQQTLVAKLSGGEKRRLHLLTVLIKNPNFIILDEPTNDLDLPTLQTLEAFLHNFPGCLVLVSHDRYFLDTLTDHLFIFEGNGKIIDFYDTYSAYREKQAKIQKSNTGKKSTKQAAVVIKNTNSKIRKLSWKEARELEQLEADLENLENEKKQIESELNGNEKNPERLIVLTERYSEIIRLIDEKSNRWFELSKIL